MTRIINLIGQKYGRLTVIERYKNSKNNRRNNRIIIYKNKKYTLSELSNFLKISNQTLLWRINNYWKEEELTLPVSLANSKNRKENNNE